MKPGKAAAFDDLIYAEGMVSGVKTLQGNATRLIHTSLVIGADGRNSEVRAKAGLQSKSFGSSRDVLWFRLGKQGSDPEWGMGHKGPKQNFIVIDRGDYWQCGYTIQKGEFDALKLAGLETLKQAMAEVAPFSAERMADLDGWDKLKLLSIRIDRLDQWMKPGVLCIGDAAHAMSPIGGVGVNLAIQDAVAAANCLTLPLKKGHVTLRDLQKVQQRRQFPTVATQFLQIKMSSNKRKRTTPSKVPQMISRFPFLRYLFGRLIGLGFRTEKPEHLNE